MVYLTSPFAIWSGPGLRFGHGAVRPVLSVYIAFALVQETGRYVPSNAVGAGGVCAFATASDLYKPKIHNTLAVFGTGISSLCYEILTLFAAACRSNCGRAPCDLVWSGGLLVVCQNLGDSVVPWYLGILLEDLSDPLSQIFGQLCRFSLLGDPG